MIHSTTEQEFEDALSSAMGLLHSQANRNGQLESDLLKFTEKGKTYAQYCLDAIPGNGGLHGNTASEQNHSSTLCFLNNGNKKENNFCEHPIVLIRELLKRQKTQVNNTNVRLFGESSKLAMER